jgi:hypothetical protein
MDKRLQLVSAFLTVVLSMVVSVSANVKVSDDKVWKEIDDSALKNRPAERLVEPNAYRTFQINKSALQTILDNAPMEDLASNRTSEIILSLPLPDGTFSRFRILESPIMEEGLAAKYPNLKTYIAQGVDVPSATARISYTPTGFRAMILSGKGSIMIDPYALGDTDNYISYAKSDVSRKNQFVCEFDNQLSVVGDSYKDMLDLGQESESVISGSTLRTYRLALAATAEYTNVFRQGGDSDAQAKARALEQQVIIMTRINGVYEKDLAIRMVLVANNDLIIYTDSATDPYTNNSGSTMLGQNTTNLNTVIGTANYDIGHVFSTGGGGVATLNGPCGSNKARGVTGLPNPVGDAFSIDYVAHEMGHQWGANHTYNSGGGCNSQRSTNSAYEPGSGITIMAYAGICGAQDLANHSIDTFHVKSLEVIVAYSQTGGGNSCAVSTATGNTPPAVASVGGTSFNIPKGTPFALTASGTDAENDSITYDWQQYDLGASTTAVPNTDSDGTARPIFRSYLPTESPTRYFPSLQYILDNANVPPSTYNCDGFTCLTGELLPAITRTMNFQVVARDNRLNGGGINTATVQVMVDGNSGPFAVTAPNTGVTVNGNSQQSITWNAANTTNAPVSAANVKISLSTDGGQTFPTTLAASTANNGSATVTIPNVQTSTARIKVEAVGNIFFDVSDANFTINQVAGPSNKSPFDFDGDNRTDISIFRATSSWWYQRSSDNAIVTARLGESTDKKVPSDYTGDGKADIASWRPSTGEWLVLRSEDLTFYAFPFGSLGDTPVPGDYDGDNKSDAAVFRPSTNTWYIQNSGGGITIQGFGTTGDQPVVADYDGDNKSDIAIFRPSVSEWWILRSTEGLFAVQFGSTGDKPVQGDYTGDGKADVAFWRPSNGNWTILRSEDFSFFAFPWGVSSDTPTPGDYDGDGKFDAAIFRPASSHWFIQRTTAGILIQNFGQPGDVPLPSVYIP